MLTGGHIAISYLLAESAKSFGIPLNNSEIYTIIIAGNISDIDFIVGLFNGKTGEAHHQNISHTPLGVLIIWLIFQILFQFSFYMSILILSALFIHLIFDDIGYWAFRLKLYKFTVLPQVNWLYPITKFHKFPLVKSNRAVLENYLFKAWPISLLELILILTALFVYFLNH